MNDTLPRETDGWLTADQLARLIKKTPSYISAMKKCGFMASIPPNLFSYQEALDWLRKNRNFRRSHAYSYKPGKAGKRRQRLGKAGKSKK